MEGTGDGFAGRSPGRPGRTSGRSSGSCTLISPPGYSHPPPIPPGGDGVKPLTDKIGGKPLRKLTAADVRSALAGLSTELSTRSLQIAHNCLVRAIRHAEAADIVGRNVAALVQPPTGRPGRPSKALTVDQARALVQAAAGDLVREGEGRKKATPYRLHAYVVLLLTTGIRPEEARALRWDHLDLDTGTMAVWRSDRAGGDTKTPKSRRTLKLPQIAVDALRERKTAQAAARLKAGELWRGGDLVFTTQTGTMLTQHNIRREFRKITSAAGARQQRVAKVTCATPALTGSCRSFP
jgi:integrase